jgi:hypothetical protein
VGASNPSDAASVRHFPESVAPKIPDAPIASTIIRNLGRPADSTGTGGASSSKSAPYSVALSKGSPGRTEPISKNGADCGADYGARLKQEVDRLSGGRPWPRRRRRVRDQGCDIGRGICGICPIHMQ